MPKNLFQDMVKVKRESKSVNKGTLGATRIEAKETPSSMVIPQEEKMTPIKQKIKENDGSQRTSSVFWIIAGVCLLFFIFALSYLFSQATVTVNPKTESFALNENFSASLDGGEDVLSFDLVVLSGEEQKIVQITEVEDVSKKAEGMVVLYNSFSSVAQKLDINTRLEGSNNKIYKTEKAVTIPGITADGKPGSVEVKVFAAEAGGEYNSAPLDFKILGFKGTPKYAKFYGRSKEALTLGFIGKSPIVSESQKASIMGELKANLQIKLFKKATDQIPSGFILFKDAVFLNIDEENTVVASLENTAALKLKGTLYGIIFNEKKITEKIAKIKINMHDESGIYMSNIRDLVFSLSSKDSTTLADIENIIFNISGDAKIVHKVDTVKLVKDILSVSKKEFNQVLLKYPNIDSADLLLSPFWKRSIPDKIKKIKVIVNYPE